MKVIDCFPFFDELDLLEIRLHELSEVVDLSVAVECPVTFSGLPKPLRLQDNRGRFADFGERLMIVTASGEFGSENEFLARALHSGGQGTMPQHEAWCRENAQRNACVPVLRAIAEPEDIVIISDLDEIPRAEVVARARKSCWRKWACDHAQYRYYLNMPDVEPITVGALITRYGLMASPAAERIVRYEAKHVVAGWHFSNCYGANAAAHVNKYRSYAHAADSDVAYLIDEMEKRGADVLAKRCAVPLDGTFPPWVTSNQERFAHLLQDVPSSPGCTTRVRPWAGSGST